MTTHRLAKWLWMFSLLFASRFVQGQNPPMSVSTSKSHAISLYTNNIADCATATDCWHDTQGAGNSVFYIKNSFYVVDSSCTVWTMSIIGKTTWVKHPEYGCVKAIYSDANGTLYAMQGTCQTGQYKLGKWSGSSFVPTFACGTSFSFGPNSSNGVMDLAVGVDAKLDISTDGWASTSNAYDVNGCEGNGGASQVAAVSGRTFLVICGDHSIWNGVWGGSTTVTYTQVSGAGLQVSVSPVGDWWVIGVDGYVYYYSNGTWLKLNQTATYLAAEGKGLEVIGPSNKVLRFGFNGLQYSVTATGNFQCNVPPPGNGICNTFTHTAYAQASFGGITSPVASHAVPSQEGSSSVSATATVVKHSAYDCIDNFGSCTPSDPEINATCNGGAQDTATEPQPTGFGESIDFRGFVYSDPPVGPNIVGTPLAGTIEGYVPIYSSDACITGVPTCPLITNPSRPWLNDMEQCLYLTQAGQNDCLSQVLFDMGRAENGFAAPYSFETVYLTYDNSPPVCVYPLVWAPGIIQELNGAPVTVPCK